MGRTAPCSTALPNHTRRAERAARAKDTINRTIPEILRSSPRTRHGIHRAERIVEPSANPSRSTMTGTHIKIRLTCSDTLSAAARLSERPFAAKKSLPAQRTQHHPNVAILNFASPLRPGGGFLDGANSQEEFLCARTSLYPSLWDSFYRLPEVGGIYTPDVLVFRDSTPEANDIIKRDRFFVDAISAGMIRFPDARGRSESGCSCGVSYCDQDRELVTNKMKAVMRIAESKGNKKLVLGAWGCGAYGNPVAEVAKIWRKVIAGSSRQRKPNAESWQGIEEVIFAIPDRNMLREFEKAFSDVLATDPVSSPSDRTVVLTPPADNETDELITNIAALESQLDNATNPRAKTRIREVLAGLNKELTRGLANKAAQDDDLTLQEDEEVDDFVVSGFPSSDMESNQYNFDEDDIASDSSDNHSEVYDFRPKDLEPTESPKFDPQTGWFSGSMDELTRMLKLNSNVNSRPSSNGSPTFDAEAAHDFDEVVIHEYLSKYGGTDAVSEAPSVR